MDNRIFGRVLRWVGIFGAIALVIGGLAWVGSKQDSSLDGKTLSVAVSADDWSRGNEQAPITIVEYSDFQCPTCGAYFPILERILDEYGDQVRVVYRHFPLADIHPNAEGAALAAEAAGKQGKFWEMHDLIFDNQDIWSNQRNPWSAFESYASELGLNIDQFKTDAESNELEDKIADHYESGLSSGVQGTPTFYVNGDAISGLPQGYPGFTAIIDAKLLELGITADASEDSTSEETAN